MSTSSDISAKARRRSAARAAAAIIGVALLALGGLFARYALIANRICSPTRSRVTEADRAEAKALLPTLEDVAFTTSDGLTLRGFYVPATNGVVVIMCHGLGENRMRFLPDASFLARRGYGSLFFDWRAHGESDGDTSTFGDREQLDARAAVDFVLGRAPASRIATLGFSVGSSAVALEAADDPRVGAVIVEAIWPTMEEEFRDKFRRFFHSIPARWVLQRRGVRFDHVRPIEALPKIAPRPILVIGGSDDLDTPAPIIERFCAAAPGPIRCWIVPGAQHGTYRQVDPAGYEAALTSFLDQSFGVTGASR